ncbi:MMPL family transporter [Nocardioides panacihumi]|uniref:MMPL family transporter n=1 Tax=Nocardioides panacihumi TaxID=400774 RepID=A0ABP5D8G9_9ACTN
MFRSIGRIVGRHPVLVILTWVGIVIGVAVVAGAVAGKGSSTSQQQTDFLPAKYGSVQAAKLSAKYFPQPSGAQATLVLVRSDHRKLSDGDMSQAATLVDQLNQRTHLAKYDGIEPTSLVRAPDRTAAIATAQFTDTSGQADVMKSMKSLRADTKDVFGHSGLTAEYTGEVAQVADAGATQALIVFGTVLAIFILLLILFRSIVVAVGAVALMFIVGQVVNMLLAIAAHIWHFKIDETTESILPIVLFGVGTDYVVFFMFRYREQLRRGEDHRTAIASAIGRVGEAVSSSAFAVVVSFAALILSQLKSLRLLGPSLSLAVLVMLASSLTLIPAVLALTGKRLSRRASWHRPPRGRVAAGVSGFVTGRPTTALLISLAAFVGLGAVAFGMHADYRSPNPPSGTESGRAWADVRHAFPQGVLYPTRVFVHTADPSGLTAGELTDTAHRLGAVSGVASVAPATLNKAGDTAMYTVQLAEDPTSPAAVAVIRDGLEPLATDLSRGAQVVKVGGITQAQSDFEQALARDMRIIFPVAALMIGLILVLMLRALLAPALLMVSVALGFAATLGASVIAFQVIGGAPGLAGTLPMIVYLFVASIGTDYNILMVARVKEEAARDGSTMRGAVRVAMQTAGPSVAAAGVILAASFAVLMLSSYVSQIGFAVAAGVLISTFLSSWLYVPALATLLEQRIWWPSKAARPTAATLGGSLESEPDAA